MAGVEKDKWRVDMIISYFIVYKYIKFSRIKTKLNVFPKNVYKTNLKPSLKD